uniref:Predicted nuclease of the RNAse H fold, HicB family n=1 Tax=Candidatus Kentrum sp. FM TaxID=2126340 RepID=A0A450TZT5_9GAMM|nr:MAG: Predicted nuclease of the RNAse H fold, HicB family [Candidatus Kentron sp. FM]VFJ75564.1 MAG: Predicted nuclease of the RNAse H fold, HicB family [Candidatus Kentron sp. FM]VFK21945.1 MAG: Predicted nuclease of the RNAse H fold, HicB family [Candidatus Kentron sp. FM]
MKLKVIIHEAEEGGYWAEVPAIPGCATQGEDIEELIENIHDAVEGCLAIDMDAIELGSTALGSWSLLFEMKTISGKRMSALLQRKGWHLVRTTGSHHIFVHPGSNLRISVPVHGLQVMVASSPGTFRTCSHAPEIVKVFEIYRA